MIIHISIGEDHAAKPTQNSFEKSVAEVVEEYKKKQDIEAKQLIRAAILGSTPKGRSLFEEPNLSESPDMDTPRRNLFRSTSTASRSE